MLGIDYATPGANIKELKRKNVKFVCRYLAPNRPLYYWKRLRADEVKALLAAGIAIVPVFETYADRAKEGYEAGALDARTARAHLRAVGLPSTTPVYFAVDYDAPERDQPRINSYLRGAASVHGASRVGVYAGYHVVKRCLDAKVCAYAWQTYAWSGGLLDKRSHIYQYSNGHQMAGVSCDYDRSLKPDFGQFPRPLKVVSPENPPNFWTWARWYRGHGEFAPYGPRNKAVRPNVPKRIAAAWWVRLRLNITGRLSA